MAKQALYVDVNDRQFRKQSPACHMNHTQSALIGSIVEDAHIQDDHIEGDSAGEDARGKLFDQGKNHGEAELADLLDSSGVGGHDVENRMNLGY